MQNDLQFIKMKIHAKSMHRLTLLLLVVMAEIMMTAPRVEANKPAPPTELRAEKSPQLEGAVELSWHPVKGAVAYEISASRENADNWQDLGATTDTNFQVNELPEATKYYFRVASKASSGQGAWSVSVMQYSSGNKHFYALPFPAFFRKRNLVGLVPSRR